MFTFQQQGAMSGNVDVARWELFPFKKSYLSLNTAFSFSSIYSYLVNQQVPFDGFETHRSQQRPIHWACVKGDIDMVNYFCMFKFIFKLIYMYICVIMSKPIYIWTVSIGVDINVTDKKGYTPLIVGKLIQYMTYRLFHEPYLKRTKKIIPFDKSSVWRKRPCAFYTVKKTTFYFFKFEASQYGHIPLVSFLVGMSPVDSWLFMIHDHTSFSIFYR